MNASQALAELNSFAEGAGRLPDRGDEAVWASTDPDTDTEELTGSTAQASASASAGRKVTANPLDPHELAFLIGRIICRDEDAMRRLYDALSGHVFAAALRYTRDTEAAEEVVQDTFWQVWRQAPRFDAQRGPVAAWVMNIARSRAIDLFRSARHSRKFELHTVDGELSPDAIDESPDPQQTVMSRDEASQLAQALAGIDPMRRQLITLAFYKGVTQEDIAAQMGMPLGTVKSLIRRTLATLKKTMTDPPLGGNRHQPS